MTCIILAVVLLALSGCGTFEVGIVSTPTVTNTGAAVSPTPTTAPTTMTNIYLIVLEDAGQAGQEVGCGDSVVPVEVQIAPTDTPMQAAFEQLLALDSRTYRESGLYNALYRSELHVENVDIVDGSAEIRLSGTVQLSGTCDTPRIEAQLRQTALQYDTVDSVSITIDGQPLDDVLSLR